MTANKPGHHSQQSEYELFIEPDDANADGDGDGDGSKSGSERRTPSLDFERIVNSYSIETTRAQLIREGKRKERHVGGKEELGHDRLDHLKAKHGMGALDTIRSLTSSDTDMTISETFDEDDPFVHVHVADDDGTLAKIGSTSLDEEEWPALRSGGKGGQNDAPTANDQGPHKKERLELNYSGQATMRWIFTCATGLSTGLMAVFIVYCVGGIGEFRTGVLSYRLDVASTLRHHAKLDNGGPPDDLGFHRGFGYTYWTIFLFFSVFNLVLAFSSALMCVYLAPSASGSGIPEVKAYLNGVRVRSFANCNLFLVKIFGTILSVSSGLAIGPEGPLVHLGAIIGSSLTKTGAIEKCVRQFRRTFPVLSGLLGCGSATTDILNILDEEKRDSLKNAHGGKKVEGYGSVAQSDDDAGQHEGDQKMERKTTWWRSSLLSHLLIHMSVFRNDFQRRDFISIGSACGFAAAFGAPVGGVLYSLEEMSSFFANTLLLKTLTATAIATFCIAVYHGDLSRYSVLTLDIGDTPDGEVLLRFEEVPLYVVLGIGGGLLGALFNFMCDFIHDKRKELVNKSHYSVDFICLMQVVLLSLFTSVIIFWAPLTMNWACRDVQDEVHGESSDNELDRYNCGVGQINELGKVLFGSRDEAILDVLQDPSQYDSRSLLLVGTIFYVLMILTYGTSLPSGIFMPSVLAGACLGGAAGIFIQQNLAASSAPSVFALLGAAGLLSGVQRNAVSLCVILMEGTGQTKVLIPVIVTVVVSRFVGGLFNEGIYEIVMEWKDYDYLDHQPKPSYDVFKVRDIMSSPAVVINSVETAGEIERLLLESKHAGFPVVDPKTQRFLGFVRRDQLIALLECGIFMKNAGKGTRLISEPIFREPGASMKQRPKRTSLVMSLTNHPDLDRPILERLDSGLASNESDLNYSILRQDSAMGQHAFMIRDDRYASIHPSKRKQCFCLNPCAKRRNAPSHDLLATSEWYADNVVTHDQNEKSVLLGRDPTLPTHGKVETNQDTVVSVLDDELVVILSPEDRSKRVNIGAVMNRGAYTVTEGVPLSKVYDLFTKLGLRHICVLGGRSQVTGIITRTNLTEKFLEERTGYKL